MHSILPTFYIIKPNQQLKSSQARFHFFPIIITSPKKLTVIITSSGTTTRGIITWAYILPGLHLLLLLERLDLTFSRERFMVRRETGVEREREPKKPDKTLIKNKERFLVPKISLEKGSYTSIHDVSYALAFIIVILSVRLPLSLHSFQTYTHILVFISVCVCCVIIISPLDMK